MRGLTALLMVVTLAAQTEKTPLLPPAPSTDSSISGDDLARSLGVAQARSDKLAGIVAAQSEHIRKLETRLQACTAKAELKK